VSFRYKNKGDKDKDKDDDDDKDEDKNGKDPTHREKGDASGSKQGSEAKGNKSRSGKKSPKKHGAKTKSATTISSTRAAYKPHTYFTRANVLWLQAEIDGGNWDVIERQANIRGGVTELGA
jgi:hypothetical protein